MDIPDDIMRKMKIQAAEQNRRLKDVVAEVLRRGLEADINSHPTGPPKVITNPKTGLPLIVNRHEAPAGAFSPDRIAQILLDQEVERYFDAG